MIITNINIRKLEPAEGKRLTNGDVIAEREVYLGAGDNPENWYEITEEECARIKAEKENDL